MDTHSIFAIMTILNYILLMIPTTHRYAGYMYKFIMCPVLLVTGFDLSMMKTDGHTIYNRTIFQLYGISFVLSHVTLFTNRIVVSQDIHKMMIVLWITTVLDMIGKTDILSQLVILFIPMLYYVHYIPMHFQQSSHGYYGAVSMYMGCMGFIFSITQDRFLLHHLHRPPLYTTTQIIIQSLPAIGLHMTFHHPLT